MTLCLDKICRTCMEYSSGRLFTLHENVNKPKDENGTLEISSPSIIEMFASLGIDVSSERIKFLPRYCYNTSIN